LSLDETTRLLYGCSDEDLDLIILFNELNVNKNIKINTINKKRFVINNWLNINEFLKI